MNVQVIGDVLFLKNDYSPDQLWLPFVIAVVVIDDDAPEMPSQKTRAHLSFSYPERNDPQYGFSFWSNLVSKGYSNKLGKAGHPTFARNQHGKLLRLALINNDANGKKQAKLWCKENCRGLVVPKSMFIFEQELDYMLAALSGLFVHD